MKLLITAFACFISVSVFGQQTINDSLLVNGIYRHFITYIPSIYQQSQATPLVFNLHGKTASADGQMWYGDFRSIADTANFIIVHPQGLLDNTGVTHWNVGQSSVDDIGFINTLYQYLLSNYNIDIDKVYSTGMSNGGNMSYLLACSMNDKFAAIASVTGSMWPHLIQSICNPSHPTPVLEIHGTSDAIVPYNSILDGIEYWRNYNNCDFNSIITSIPNINLEDNSMVEHIVYNNGDNGVTTEIFKIINGGHSWPGTSFPNGETNYDINASLEIWRFFSKYDINGIINQPSSITYYNINKKLVKIIDALGREMNHTSNKILYHIYDDGSVEKKFIVD